ncbi:MAG: hypothetical protein HN348_20810 [Proteobacteria bacterium]|jgi:hypothetical protein|nr:hypothetical protein [Pseudomonadota bacterium]
MRYVAPTKALSQRFRAGVSDQRAVSEDGLVNVSVEPSAPDEPGALINVWLDMSRKTPTGDHEIRLAKTDGEIQRLVVRIQPWSDEEPPLCR